MVVIYRNDGAWGTGKGSNLTSTELDGNFYDLDGRVTTLEAAQPDPISVSSITYTNGAITINMSDASVYGPFPLPMAKFNWRGEWQPSTVYDRLDIVTVTGLGIYLVNENHTSETVFDPVGLEIVSGGGPTYIEMLRDFNLADGSGVSGGSEHQPYFGGVYTIEDTSSMTHQPTLLQAGGYFRMVGTATQTFEIPADSTVNFPVGTRFYVRNGTTGSGTDVQVTRETTAVSIFGPGGTQATWTTTAYGDVAELVKVAANKWEISGGIT